ncbi:MAG: hypothetical protein R3335_01800, partial [Anaerolineales bacterium]|nr:hypothetical protein [Anaerolineales bacterium]
MNRRRTPIQSLQSLIIIIAVGLVAAGLLINAYPANAQTGPIHPDFPILDDQGRLVVESGRPVSTMETCGACHDTEFIASHSGHADVGLEAFSDPGIDPSGREWDSSAGWFGEWNPLTYRYLTADGDDRLDLSTAGWLQTLGLRHVGGGPAQTSRDGRDLRDLEPDPGNPEASLLDAESGEVIAWSWEESGVVEMTCFLCHLDEA